MIFKSTAKILILFLFALALLTPPSICLPQDRPAERHILDNGLICVVKETDSTPVVALACLVMAGSTTEGEYTGSGISHFVEHMLFKGTEARKVGQIAREIRALGGEVQGSTSFDYTIYEITIPSRHFDKVLAILSDALMNSAFPLEEMEKERSVVLNEIRLNRDDPKRRLHQLLWSTAFSVHPYRHPVTGYEPLFIKLTREDLLDYYHKMYIPNNMVLAIVGDIDKDRAILRAKDAFSNFEMQSPIPRLLPLEPLQLSSRSLIKECELNLTYLALGFHGPGIADPDLYAMDVLAAILGEGKSSRLYKKAKEEKKLVHSINAWSYTPIDPGIFGIVAQLDESNIQGAIDAILDEVKDVKYGEIHERELTRAQKLILTDFRFSQETMEGQARHLAIDEAVAGDFNFSERYIEGINSVTEKEAKEVAQKYLSFDNLTITALVPKHEVPIEKRESTRFKKPLIKRKVLENGLVVLLKNDDETLPICSIKAVFTGGVRVEPEREAGLSNFAAQMLLKGTKGRSANQIAEAIESIGGNASAYGGNNSFGISLDLLSDDLEIGLDILRDCLINSNFPESQIERVRSTIIAEIKGQEDDIFDVASKTLVGTLYEIHPYRFRPQGTIESVTGIKRNEILDFYSNYVTSKNMVLAIFGDIQIDDTLGMVKKKFKNLSQKTLPIIKVPKEPEKTSKRAVIRYMDKEQSLAMLGFPTIDLKNEDRYVFEVITNVFSGQGSRLFDAVREKLGLAYMVGSYHVLGLDPGYYVVYAAVDPPDVEKVIDVLIGQIELLKSAPCATEELERAKENLIGSQEINLQTNSALAFQTSLDELYGLGYQSYKDYPAKVSRVTKEDIVHVANRYFNLKGLAIITIRPKVKVLSAPKSK